MRDLKNKKKYKKIPKQKKTKFTNKVTMKKK